MSSCCCPPSPAAAGDPCRPAVPACCQPARTTGPSPHFDDLVDHTLAWVQQAKAQDRPIIGICCEFTPREVLMAAGAVPICLCGGSAATIPAAEEHLPANLCPLIKSTFGYHLTGSNPLLELCDLVVAETTCDGKKKMYELMAETRPMHVLALPQRADQAGRDAWRAEVRRLAAELEHRFGRAITNDSLREAIATLERERVARRALAALLFAPDPPLTGRELLALRSLAAGIPADLAEYDRLLAELPGRHVAQRDGVRVLLTGVPVPHGAERVLDLIEAHGGLVVAQENCTGLKPLQISLDAQAEDPLTAIADAYLHLPCSVMSPNPGRWTLLRELATWSRAQCVVELVWQACLTYDIEAQAVRRLAAGLGLPYLRIGTDYSSSDSARIAVRLEALFETVRSSDGAPA